MDISSLPQYPPDREVRDERPERFILGEWFTGRMVELIVLLLFGWFLLSLGSCLFEPIREVLAKFTITLR